jgi:hypothetical protein
LLFSIGLAEMAAAGYELLTNTEVQEAEISNLIVGASPVAQVTSALVHTDDLFNPSCGIVQSAAYDLGSGLFLYAYQLESHTTLNPPPGSDTCVGVGLWFLIGLGVPMGSNEPAAVDIDSAGELDTSWQIVSPAPYSGALAFFNESDLSAVNTSGGPWDEAFYADASPYGFFPTLNEPHVGFEFPNVGTTTPVFGFVTAAAPEVREGEFLIGNGTNLQHFDLVVPQSAPVTGQAAGRVPDGDALPGLPLTVDKPGGGDVTLTWGFSCQSGDTDYEIYEGTIGAYYSHDSRFCSTGGATTMTFAPAAGNTYYLVVPTNGSREGSYGTATASVERPQGGLACSLQLIGTCP